MRLKDMKNCKLATAALALSLFCLSMPAQRIVGKPNPGETFKDTSMLKPPTGVKIAIIEWQDLMCPSCAHAFPIVHAAVEKYKIPIYEKDFLLGGEHGVQGDKEAAVWARYLQDKVSPQMADAYRGTIFAAQSGIASKDDLAAFTRRFFQSHGLKMPFVPDPSGALLSKVMADRALGDKLGMGYTPCIIVCTQKEWVHVTDVSLLSQTIVELEAKLSAPEGKPAKVRKATP